MRNRSLLTAALVMAPMVLGACGGGGDTAARRLLQVKDLCKESGATSVDVYRQLPLVSYGVLGVLGDDAEYRGQPRWPDVLCGALEVVGRLDESGIPPDDLPYGAKPWLRVRARSGPSIVGWIRSPLTGANARLERALDRLPAASAAPEHPKRRPDLTFGPTETTAKQGEACTTPGQPVPVGIIADIKNVGAGTVKSTTVEVRAQGGLQPLRFNRGLEPGEKYQGLGFFPGERAVVDPRNQIRESNENNNSLEVGSVPVLVCRPQ